MTPAPSNPGISRGKGLTRAFQRLKRTVTRRSSSAQDSEASRPTSTIPESSHLPLQPEDTSQVTPLMPKSYWPETLEVDDGVNEQPINHDIRVPISRQQSSQSRLLLLGSQYGINVEQFGLEINFEKSRSGIPRVEKKIKMRVRYSCHKCDTSLGPSKICSKCDHYRCRECYREPVRRNRERVDLAESMKAIRARSTKQIKSSDTDLELAQTSPIIHRSNRSSGMRTPRVQYACHECDTAFVIGTAQCCPNCGHRRCESCTRQLSHPVETPNNPKKTVTIASSSKDQADNQRTWKQTRARVRWTCEECQTRFEKGSKTCINCNHKRCEGCIRLPARSIRAESKVEAVEVAPSAAQQTSLETTAIRLISPR